MAAKGDFARLFLGHVPLLQTTGIFPFFTSVGRCVEVGAGVHDIVWFDRVLACQLGLVRVMQPCWQSGGPRGHVQCEQGDWQWGNPSNTVIILSYAICSCYEVMGP